MTHLDSTWKLETAKARFSEVVRRAHEDGPQTVTVRGRRSVVVIDAETYDRLVQPEPATDIVTFLESLYVPGLDLERPRDTGRDVDL
jgi:antitoxin Phd